MHGGKLIGRFRARDGRNVVLRTPRWEDLDDLLELINSLVEEGAEIYRDTKVSREEELDWLAKTLVSLEKDEVFFLAAEVDGKVVASSDVHRLRGYESHVGVLGIVTKNGYRDFGIGTEMMKRLVEQSQKMGLKVLTLTAFASNSRAIHVYEKFGFAETGRVPKKHFKDGHYIDQVIMTKVME